MVVGHNGVEEMVPGRVEWRLVWIRKEGQKLFGVTSFFSTLINWIIINDPCVSKQ